jgi:ABC-type uncharacterized transport system fused permease/ATPase subunit
MFNTNITNIANLLTQQPEYADLTNQLQSLTYFMSGDISIDSYIQASDEFNELKNKLSEFVRKWNLKTGN